MSTIVLNWNHKNIGELLDGDDLSALDCGGVYLWVYKNGFEHPRVIYVGEASASISKRFNSHLKYFKTGLRTFYRIPKGEDIVTVLFKNVFDREMLDEKFIYVPGFKMSFDCDESLSFFRNIDMYWAEI
jgi:hypothetical protein